MNASLILGELDSAVCTKLTSSSSNRIRRASIQAYIQWKLYNKVTLCGSHLPIQATLLGPNIVLMHIERFVWAQGWWTWGGRRF